MKVDCLTKLKISFNVVFMRTFKKVDRPLIQSFRGFYMDGLGCIFINCDSHILVNVTDLHKIRKEKNQKITTMAGAALSLEKILKEKLACPVNKQVGFIRIEFDESKKTKSWFF